MRYLGIDYGDKRIGLAISDEDGMFAFPRTTVENSPAVFLEIKKMCEEEKIGKIILGIPVSFSGELSAQAKAVRRFGDMFAETTRIPIAYENEILTTSQAERSGAGRKTIDQSSAALILQGWLDRVKK
ncbi:Holliday junction resolvase RuvX [Candidatus Azambacteria bacterium]|nr:Holliday junction resolvase RuvX [Candidatus Azambacteria bacterium]